MERSVFIPRNEFIMHVLKSLDYGIVVEGEMEMRLDSGEAKVMKRGDVAFQRAPMPGWKNRSDTEWARMFFVLEDCPQA
jgi:quercetin dioxygenase-like cupin family protein